MVSKALRLHGKEDLRLDEITLPAIKDDEILCKVVSDSICMSSYKAALQGAEHKRVPENVAEHPVIIGHELCGEIVEVGKKWQDKFKPGQKFAVQPALNYQGTMDAIGYSFEYAGGCATYIICPINAWRWIACCPMMETRSSTARWPSHFLHYRRVQRPISLPLQGPLRPCNGN